MKEIADAWLFDVLGEAFRRVSARDDVGLDPIERAQLVLRVAASGPIAVTCDPLIVAARWNSPRA